MFIGEVKPEDDFDSGVKTFIEDASRKLKLVILQKTKC